MAASFVRLRSTKGNGRKLGRVRRCRRAHAQREKRKKWNLDLPDSQNLGVGSEKSRSERAEPPQNPSETPKIPLNLPKWRFSTLKSGPGTPKISQIPSNFGLEPSGIPQI